MARRAFNSWAGLFAIVLSIAFSTQLFDFDRLPLVLDLPYIIEWHYSTYYGPGKGLRNKDGTPFTGEGLTCASNVFRRGTILDLTFRGITIRVRVNDFGPTTDPNNPLYNTVHDVIDGRVTRWKSIDCSVRVARELGFARYGAARLQVYVVKDCGRYANNVYDKDGWCERNQPVGR